MKKKVMMNQIKRSNFALQLDEVQGIGSELLDKQEFEFLVNYFLETETLTSLIVGLIEEKLFLIVLTNQRLFFVKKQVLNLHSLVRKGLEEIKNLELQPDLGHFSLVFSFLNGEKIKINSLSESKAKRFGQLVFKQLKN
jgi:hypothetical protein